MLPQDFQNGTYSQIFASQVLAVNLTTSGFLLDSQAGRPYDLNHKQVLTVAFPSNLILPYITLANSEGPVKQADGVEWGPSGPRSEP